MPTMRWWVLALLWLAPGAHAPIQVARPLYVEFGDNLTDVEPAVRSIRGIRHSLTEWLGDLAPYCVLQRVQYKRQEAQAWVLSHKGLLVLNFRFDGEEWRVLSAVPRSQPHPATRANDRTTD